MKEERSAFSGNWLVSEYLYTPAGEFVGLIHQRRRVQPNGELTRVIQITEKVELAESISDEAKALAGIMDERAGASTFDLKLAGQARHYLGEDVIGGGFSWKDGVLTAKGLWTRFGYNFTSFSILLNPRRQVTGGRYYKANQEIAVIVGVAVPEEEGFPEMTSGDMAKEYRGERFTISPDGELIETTSIATNEHTFTDKEGLRGNEKEYGALREMECVTAPGETISAIEIADHASGSVAGIWKKFRDEKLSQVEVYVLKANER